MKKIPFIASVILLTSMYCFGQPDKQWLIVDGLGKTGWIQTTNGYSNVYGPGNVIQQTVTLSGISHPVRTPQNSFTKNDLFVIYDDGQYFSSRTALGTQYNSLNDPFYPRLPGQSLSQTSHNLQTSHSSTIKYLYMTNIYEGDDPPDLLSAISGHDGQNSTPYTFGITLSTPIMTASHDVTKESDITLIIPAGVVKNGDLLTFNQTSLRSGSGGIQTDIYFEGSPIFNNGTQFCNVPVIDNGNGTITFTTINPSNPPFIFVNLRATAKLPKYFATDASKNSKAIFVLNPNDTDSKRRLVLEENIAGSHDPNYVELQRVCKNPAVDGSYNIFYHIEFQNDGVVSANHLSVELSLPKKLKAQCLNVSKWSAGGKQVTGTVSVEGRKPIGNTTFNSSGNTPGKGKQIKITFDFDEEATVQPYQKYNPGPSVGYIAFCLKIKGRQPSRHVDSNYKLIDPKVYFDHDAYPIFEFYHTKLKKDSNGGDKVFPESVSQCSCDCRNP